jgi:hypothetical protein
MTKRKKKKIGAGLMNKITVLIAFSRVGALEEV